MSDFIINFCIFASLCLLVCLIIWCNLFFLFYFLKQKRDK